MERGLRRKMKIYEDACPREYKEQIAKEIDNSIIDMLANDIKKFSTHKREFDLADIIYNSCGMGIVCDLLSDINDYKESEFINETQKEVTI